MQTVSKSELEYINFNTKIVIRHKEHLKITKCQFKKRT